MHRRVVAAVALALLVASCTGEEPGDPSMAATSSAEPSATSSPADEAPTVANPLDVSHFRQAPCDAISDEKITEYFGPGLEGRPDTDSAASAACVWNKSASQARLAVGFVTPVDDVLGNIYAQRHEWAYFEELGPINGYPTLAVASIDKRDEGECVVVTAVNDREVVDVRLALSEERVGEVDPCGAAHEAAGVVLENIQRTN